MCAFMQSEALWVRYGVQCSAERNIRAVFLVLSAQRAHSQLFRYSKEKHYASVLVENCLYMYVYMLFNKYVCVFGAALHIHCGTGKTNIELLKIVCGKFCSLFFRAPGNTVPLYKHRNPLPKRYLNQQKLCFNHDRRE